MPENERTQFSTPIPLRDNGIESMTTPMPNPYTRLEAVGALHRHLHRVLADLAPTPDTFLEVALHALAVGTEEMLTACIWGDLAAVEAVRNHLRDLEAGAGRLQGPAGPG